MLGSLLEGLQVTVILTVCAALLAIPCAFAAGLARVSLDPIVRATARAYVEVFRGTSALVQLFWFYFAFPLLFGIELSAFTVGVVVLGLNAGAYGAEIVRGAVQAVPAAQHEAATVLGMSRWQRLRHVIVPQAVLAMLPPFGNLMIELLKSTALVSLITVTDLMRAGLFLRDETLRTGEIFVAVLLLYFGLALLITSGVRALERRASRGRHVGEGR